MVQLLLDHEPKIYQAMTDGATSLPIAVQRGHLRVVQLLLEDGVEAPVFL